MSAFEEPKWNHLRLKEVQTFIDQLMFHPVLRDELALPIVSKLQLFLGALVLSQTRLSSTVSDRILAAMVLMHHGLDLHESIQDEEVPQSTQAQLTILGGAFFSSLFYRLLAEANRIDLVSAFSKAVSKINEAKSSIHDLPPDAFYDDPQYITYQCIVQGELLTALCEIFSPDVATKDFVDLAIMASVYDQALSQMHAKSKKFSRNRLHLNFSETMERLFQASRDVVGSDAWLPLKSLFHTSINQIDGVRVGEGG